MSVTVLSVPHVLKVVLRNDGRRDIPSDAFDGNQPLKLDVGVPILELLSVSSTPAGHRIPLCAVQGSTVLIGPGLIARRQQLVLSVPADRAQPVVSLDAALVDVRLRQYADGEPAQSASRRPWWRSRLPWWPPSGPWRVR